MIATSACSGIRWHIQLAYCIFNMLGDIFFYRFAEVLRPRYRRRRLYGMENDLCKICYLGRS